MHDTISDRLLRWYEVHKRDLPWRKTKDPYLIWVSEIIFQQTRIDQGMDYYLRFTEKFPDVRTLADAEEQEVLKYWQGLGYYSRARNIHFAAQQIRDFHDGNFPSEYEQIIQLKGVGPYTAAAISSIAFHKPYPVIDGNVNRVISRLFGIQKAVNTKAGSKEVEDKLKGIFNPDEPGNFNQAMMELGALVCKPLSPDCKHCALKSDCVAFNKDEVGSYPLKVKSKAPKSLYLYYFVFCAKMDGEQIIFLKKREEDSIWKNMYDFPGHESNSILNISHLITKISKKFFNNQIMPQPSEIIGPIKHQLTHRNIEAYFIKTNIDKGYIKNLCKQFHPVNDKNMRDLPMPKLIENYIEKNIF